MRKADGILLIVVLLLGVVGCIIIYFFHPKASVVSIVVNGEEIQSCSLSDNREILIETGENGKNLLRIEDGKVKMISANCPNQDCVNHKEIMYGNESIVCLPHKIAVIIKEASQNDAPDTIVY